MKILIIILFLFTSISAISGEIADRTISSLKLSFGNDVQIDKTKLKLENNVLKSVSKQARQKFLKEFVYFYKIQKDGELLGYGILDNVFGKLQPITVLAVFDINGDVIDSYIIKYREQHGKQVKNKTWLKQFAGKNIDSDFSLGKGIESISGATMSARAVSLGIKRLTILNKYLNSNEH